MTFSGEIAFIQSFQLVSEIALSDPVHVSLKSKACSAELLFNALSCETATEFFPLLILQSVQGKLKDLVVPPLA